MANFSQKWVTFYLEEKILEIGKCVRIAICKVYLVMVIKKLIVPLKGIVRLKVNTALTIAVLVVLDILSTTMPA